YAQNPNNFSKEQWESLQQVKRACEEFKLKTITTLEKPEKREKNLKFKEGEKQTKRFAKKRDWLSM
ncbi:MAG: hypothetical protein ACKVOH_05510, partial [Chlamydiales bacterium]